MQVSLSYEQYLGFRRELGDLLIEISLYGASPIDQMLNPRLNEAAESANENTTTEAMQVKCFKAFALYWLIKQYHPQYFNFSAANELPRALSMTGWRGAYKLGNKSEPETVLLPYIEGYLQS